MSQKVTKNTLNKYICELCDFTTNNKYDFSKHNNTSKHKNNIQSEKINKSKFICYSCNYFTCNKNDFNKHNLTAKHKFHTTNINESHNDNTSKEFNCVCGKQYISRQGLYIHKKKCIINKTFHNVPPDNQCKNENNYINNDNLNTNNINLNTNEYNTNEYNTNENLNNTNNENIYNNFIYSLLNNDLSNNVKSLSNEVIMELVNQNKDIKELLFNQQKQLLQQQDTITSQQQQIYEMLPKIGNTINSNIKQRFNIQVFLNEQCKNAINLDDFINSIKVSVQQLDYTTNNGLANGLTNIIMENMKNLSMYERPLHCTDLKRETLYIKKDDCWSKDDNNEVLKKAINNVSTKQYKALNTWVQENPDYTNNETKQYYYAKSLSTLGKPTNIIDNKIIKNLCTKNHLKNQINK